MEGEKSIVVVCEGVSSAVGHILNWPNCTGKVVGGLLNRWPVIQCVDILRTWWLIIERGRVVGLVRAKIMNFRTKPAITCD